MTILALDLGRKKTGVALSSGVVAEGYATLPFDDKKLDGFTSALKKIIKEQTVGQIVVGLPFGKDGKETDQSKWTRIQADKIQDAVGVSVVFTEESYSSAQAEGEEGDIDQSSAVIILEQYLNETKSSSL